MTLIFNGTPQGPVGPMVLQDTPWDPPWDNGGGPPGSGGVAGKDISRCRTRQDAGGRFGAAVKYWEFECRPGDVRPGQSGERIQLVRAPNQDGEALGVTRYYGISVKLQSPWVAPSQFILFLEMKMQYLLSPAWSLIMGKNNNAPEGSGIRQMWLYNISGPCVNGTYGPGFNFRVDNAQWPPFLDPVPLDVWIDFIVGVKYARDNTGWSTVWHKLATSSTWIEFPVVVNAPTAMWNSVTLNPEVSFAVQGIYRGTDHIGTTHITYQSGCYIATTFDDIATGIYAASAPTGFVLRQLSLPGADPLILGHDPVAGAVGFRLRDSSMAVGKWKHTWDDARTQHKFAPGRGPYTVQALDVLDEDTHP